MPLEFATTEEALAVPGVKHVVAAGEKTPAIAFLEGDELPTYCQSELLSEPVKRAREQAPRRRRKPWH